MRFLMLLMICTVMVGCAQNSISALNDKINDIKKAAEQGEALLRKSMEPNQEATI
ncbi:hypothetical protein JC606_22900 [Vibrio sp. IB15]|uniref:hypothetical protein n=1 Tax=Vibrio sp. IB15 TaxID=2779368 RepID=UPI0018E7FAFE|nr:hypothetical protein [Vibrio sp. IB15]MBJ2149170.1 hypothetical protein [Vibrio sp. IB15]